MRRRFIFRLPPRTLALAAGGVVAVLAGCVFLEKAPLYVATPLPVSGASPAAGNASIEFWNALRGDNYAALPGALDVLEAADRASPDDAHLSMLTGMGYAWLYFGQYSPDADALQGDPAYRARLAAALDQSVAHLTRAQQLAPGDRILPGFVAAARFLQARVNHDQAAEDAAYQELLSNTKAYPQFQGFIQGWVLTAMYPPASPRFQDGINGYFASLDSCVGFSVSPSDPSAPAFVFNILAKADPACYDTDIAPHNLEGTFLGLGDAFAKRGQLAQARASYENALRVPAHLEWPFLHLLEERLDKLDQLNGSFNATSGQPRVGLGPPVMFFQAYYSCTACHQG
jgi:tetratricopeptide (TPR) repeat protein